MDTQQLIADAKARFKHQESKLYLQEKYTNKLTFTHQSGMWTATTNFLSFLSIAKHNQTEIVIADNFNNPIKVVIDKLEKEAWNTYNNVMKEWLEEYKQLQKKR